MSDTLIVQNGVEKKAPTLFSSGMNINLTIKHSTFDGEIDMSKLTWKDAKRLRKLRAGIQDGSVNEDDLVDMIDDIILAVAGQAPDDLPAEVVNKICQVLFAGDAQETAAEGN